MSKFDSPRTPLNERERNPLVSETDINYILLNGAQIALTKLKRATTTENSLFYYAEIGAYLEVSLSRGAGISDSTREELQQLHSEATRGHMGHNKALNIAK